MKLKKKYEGKVLFEIDGEQFYECTFNGVCLWKLDYDDLLASTSLTHPNAKRIVSLFKGNVCNCPDMDRKDSNCPRQIERLIYK